jgi:hypothetical protein
MYRCFDRFGTLLYAGVTDGLNQRMRQHATEKFWWGDVEKTTSMAFATREQGEWAEWAVITTCNPLYNAKASIPSEHKCPEVKPEAPQPRRYAAETWEPAEPELPDPLPPVGAGIAQGIAEMICRADRELQILQFAGAPIADGTRDRLCLTLLQETINRVGP